MPIIFAECGRCGGPIEIDSEDAIIVTGTPEVIWRAIRSNYREGEVIDTQVVADMTFLHRTTVGRNLKELSRFGLVRSELKRRGGTYCQWIVVAKHPTKIYPLVVSSPISKVA